MKAPYLGSEYKGNYVWTGAMNLAWNELNESILRDKLKLKTGECVSLEMAETLNQASFTKDDLDEESYYVKSGYGQKTVELINQASRAKFPGKSFDDLKLSLGPKDIIAYAYFLKQVEYRLQFKEKDVLFEKENVKGFYADGATQKANVKILKYRDDNRFIISLKLKDESDELILAKGFDMRKPEEVVDEINLCNDDGLQEMGPYDQFEIPKLHLDHHRDYGELRGKSLANKGFEEYFIAQMFEKIKFDMDHKGARVESEAAIVVAMGMRRPEIKRLLLDKPFWVVMKRKNSRHPYFLLGVANTGLMNKVTL